MALSFTMSKSLISEINFLLLKRCPKLAWHANPSTLFPAIDSEIKSLCLFLAPYLCKNYQENWHNYLERLKEAGHTRKKP